MTAIAASSYAAAEHQRICRHEAFHATAGLLLDGVEVRRAAAPFRAWPEHTAPGAQIGQTWIRGSDLRATAIGLIAGPIGETGRAPFWPLIAATPGGDEAQISELVGQLGLDEAGYGALVDEARELCASPRFKRLASVVAAELERHGVLDGTALRRLQAITEEDEEDTMDEFEPDAVELDPEAVAFGREFAADLTARMRADRDDALREKALPVARRPVEVAVFGCDAGGP